jgi:hypothetical protein
MPMCEPRVLSVSLGVPLRRSKRHFSEAFVTVVILVVQRISQLDQSFFLEKKETGSTD